MRINSLTVDVVRETYTLKLVPLHCNLLLVLQSQVTNVLILPFIFRVCTI